MKAKVIRTATIPMSLNLLLKGQLAYLNREFEVVAVSGEGKDLDIVRDREGVRTFSIEMQRQISPIRDLISLWRLYKFFKTEKPIIVHSITPKAGLLTMLAGKLAGVPHRMHTFTGLIFPTRTGLMQKLLIKMDQLLCWAATDIFPEGQGVKKDLENYSITSKPLNVLANGNVNGVDVKFFDPSQVSLDDKKTLRQKLGIAEDDYVFIFIGRLVGDKGINELVEAFDTLDHSKAKMLFVGPEEKELDPLRGDTIQRIKSNGAILTVGYQSDVRAYLAIADALVFPSYREGFPNVVLQAGAMGLPSIVTNISGSNEIVVDGFNGKVISLKNVEALREVMEDFLGNRYGEVFNAVNIRQRVVDLYAQEVVWNALSDEYKKIEV